MPHKPLSGDPYYHRLSRVGGGRQARPVPIHSINSGTILRNGVSGQADGRVRHHGGSAVRDAHGVGAAGATLGAACLPTCLPSSPPFPRRAASRLRAASGVTLTIKECLQACAAQASELRHPVLYTTRRGPRPRLVDNKPDPDNSPFCAGDPHAARARFEHPAEVHDSDAPRVRVSPFRKKGPCSFLARPRWGAPFLSIH